MSKAPSGELAIQNLAMPANTNPNGDIFGGWVLSHMDLAAGILAKKLSCGRVATVAINSMHFLKAVKVGDVISCYVKLLKQGNTSMTIEVEVWALPSTQEASYLVTQGVFVFVAIDEFGKPRPVVKPHAT